MESIARAGALRCRLGSLPARVQRGTGPAIEGYGSPGVRVGSLSSARAKGGPPPLAARMPGGDARLSDSREADP